MAGAKFDKGTEEWMMFKDYWNLCMKFWVPEENERYWDEAVAAANEFCRKCQNDLFARKIADALLISLEEKAETQKPGGG